MTSELKLKEIAERITAHLVEAEADREWNRVVWESAKHGQQESSKLYSAHAAVAGPRVSIQYVSYQGNRSYKKAEALAYLAWLDAGNRGTIRQQQSSTEPSPNEETK